MKRLLLLSLIIFSLLNLSGVFADVSASCGATSCVMNNTLIMVKLISNENLETWAYNGTAWEVISKNNIFFQNGTNYSVNIEDATFSILENSPSKAVIKMTWGGVDWNATLLDGVPWWTYTNTTVVLASTHFEIYNTDLYTHGVENEDVFYMYYPNYTTESLNFSSKVYDTTLGTYLSNNYVALFNPDSNFIFLNLFSSKPNRRTGYTGGVALDWQTSTSPNVIGFGVISNINLIQTGTTYNYTSGKWGRLSGVPTDYALMYFMDENTGTTLDNFQGNSSLDGTITNATWTPGKELYALNFTGTLQYVTTGYLPNLNNITICGWYYPIDRGETIFYWAKGLTGAVDYYAKGSRLNASHSGVSMNGWGYDMTPTGSTGIKFNEWSFVCWVVNSTHKSMYINGQYRWQQVRNPATNVEGNFYLGRYSAYDNYMYMGKQDLFKIYLRALNPNEILALYGLGLPDSLDASYPASWNGLTTSTSFAELLANLSLRTATYSEEVKILGTNSNYTSKSYTYGEITDAFSITPNYFMTWNNNTYLNVPFVYNLSIPSSNGYERLLITSASIGSLNYTTQNYAPVGIGYANTTGLTNTLTVNFKDENTQEDANASLTVSIQYSGGADYGLTNSSEVNSHSLFIYPYYGVLNTSLVHFYYGSAVTGYRSYYSPNLVFSNSSQSITLYLNSLTTGVSITVKDQYTNPYEGVLVQALRYYDDEGAYKLVTSGYTDDDGIVVLQLELSKFYKFIIYTDEGNYEYTYWITGNKEIVINPATADPFFSHYNGVTTTFSFNNVTNNTILRVYDLTGIMNNATLIVNEVTLGSEGNICNISNYTAGGFYVYCYLGNNTTSRSYQVYATATYSDGYTETIYSGYLTTGATPPAYRNNGLILSIMIIGLFAIAGAYYGGIVCLAMTGLAVFLTKLLGWLPLDNGGVMLIIAMIVVIYVIGRRSGVVR